MLGGGSENGAKVDRFESRFGDVIARSKGKRGQRERPGFWLVLWGGYWYQCLEYGTSNIDMENIYEVVATGLCRHP